MGIPKFYRWLSERYPLISAPIEADFIPDFDNLYLDMNGIIHNCTHPEWNDNYLNRLSEKEMTFAIFQYIDKLIYTVKPRKLIYMAIDGCAPRAKMNQQRQRRFKSAQESREALAIAKEKGQKVPDEEDLFDSNCITPGTEFMARLSESIKYFVRAKMRDDTIWRNVKVIFSGHEVPGEGEHKIMEYIRNQKNQPDYELNQKHCLYGLDADLIMLSLVSHEPNFALLREEVVFGRKNKRAPETPTTFQLLYINLLREYLDQEFKAELPFGYDLERVLDDFILMCFFVGNDFLPELPYMDIAEGALDKMFDIYREVLPTMGGYLTNAGEMNLSRCAQFIARLAKHEQEMLSMMPSLHLEVLEHSILRESDDYYDSEEEIDEDNYNGESLAEQLKRKKEEEEKRKATEDAKKDGEEKEADEVAAALAELDGEETICFGGAGATGQTAAPAEPKKTSPPASKPEESEEEDDEDDGVWRNWYYRDKFRIGLENEEFHNSLRQSYLEGLAWVLKYYYYGCVSWAWFYPYHYAPLATDLGCLEHFQAKFELGTPFHPFEQLMGVLPPQSKRLLPKPYQELMTNATSPIIDYYPAEFKVDMNGKRNPWEGIAIIPFIDQERLLEALHTIPQEKLTPNEQQRNSFGKAHIFVYDPQAKEIFPSPEPTWFDDLAPSYTSCLEYEDPACPDYKPPYLLPGTNLGLKGPPGFPTLTTLSFTSHLAYVGLSLFGMNSRKQSLVLKLAPKKPAKVEEPTTETSTEKGEPEKIEPEDKSKEKEEKDREKEASKKSKEEKKDKDLADAITAPDVAREVLGKSVYTSWPYLREAVVLGVSDSKCRVSQSLGVVAHTPEDGAVWQKEMKYQLNKYKSKKAIDLGLLHVMLHVQVISGMKVHRDGSRTKVFAPAHEIVPYQTVVLEHHAPDPKLQERAAPDPDAAFPIGKEVIYLGPGPAYGGMGTVVAHVSRNVPHKKPKVKIEIEVPPPLATFGARIAAQMQERYYHLSEVSRKLNISPKVLSKVTASVYTQFQNRKINIGLRIKFTRKMQQVLGYTQRIETAPATDSSYGRGYWMLSAKAFELVKAYKEDFPDLFESMEREDAQEIEVFTPEMLFPNGNHVERMQEVDIWLRALETSSLPRVPCGSKSMSAEAIKAIEEEAQKYNATIADRKVKKQVILANPTSLISPLVDVPAQDVTGTPYLGERVMNIRGSGPVPFGLQGTVVGIIDGLLEIVFDKEFIGGINLNHRCSDGRAQKHIPYSSVLSLSSSIASKMRNVNHHQAATSPQQGGGYKGQQQQQQAPGKQSQPNRPPHVKGQGSQQPQHHQHQPRGAPNSASPTAYVKKSKSSTPSNNNGNDNASSTTSTTTTTTKASPSASPTTTPPAHQKQRRNGGGRGAAGDNVVYRPKQPTKNGDGAKPASGKAAAGGELKYVQKRPAGASNGGAADASTPSTTPSGPAKEGDNYDPIAFWNSLQQPQQGGQQPQQPQQGGQQQPQQHKKKGGRKPQQQQQQQQPPQQPFMPYPMPGQPLYYPAAPPPYGPGMPMFAGPRGFTPPPLGGPFPGGPITIPPELYQGGILPTPQLNWQQQALLGMAMTPGAQPTTPPTTTSTTSPSDGGNHAQGKKSGGGGGGRGRGRRQQGGQQQQQPQQWKQRNKQQGEGGAGNNQPQQQGQQPPQQQPQQGGQQQQGGGRRGNNQHHQPKRQPRQHQQQPQQQQQGGQQQPQQQQGAALNKDAKDQLTWQQKLLLK